jgi:hypothetical protein
VVLRINFTRTVQGGITGHYDASCEVFHSGDAQDSGLLECDALVSEFFRNVGNHSPHETAFRPRRHEASILRHF